jgi:hypothetical protein
VAQRFEHWPARLIYVAFASGAQTAPRIRALDTLEVNPPNFGR